MHSSIFKPLLNILLSFSLSPLIAKSQDSTWDRYLPSHISSVISSLDKHKMKGEFTIAPGQAAYRVDLPYLGKTRPITKSTLEFIKIWGKTFGINADLNSIYTHEACFQYESREIWFPIQSELIPHLQNEFPNGGMIEIKIAWLGHISEEIVLVINGYGPAAPSSK